MAEIHAIQNGNWADASTWDLGRIPDFGDIVYIENYNIATVTANADKIIFNNSGTMIGSKEINANIDFVGNPNQYYISGATTLNGDFYENSITYDKIIFNSGAKLNGNGQLNNSILFSVGTYVNWYINGDISFYNRSSLLPQSSGNYNFRFEVNGKLFIDESSVVPFMFGVSIVNDNNFKYIEEIDSYSRFPFFNTQSLGSNYSEHLSLNKVTMHNAPYLTNGTFGNITFGDVDIKNGTLTKNTKTWIIKGAVKLKDTTITVDTTRIIAQENFSFHNYGDTSIHVMSNQQYDEMLPAEKDVKEGVQYGADVIKTGTYATNYPQEANVLKDVEYGDNQVGTLEVIALSGATATADNISVVNLTEQQLQRVGNCATVSTVQKCFEEFKE